MKTEKKRSLKNDKHSLEAQELADLAVTGEQAEYAKGGGDDRPTEELSLGFTKVEFKYIPVR
jgi:hypothetical protein